VVIRGNGIGALTCAARLGRSASLRGRVRLAAPRAAENRRLENGCTLRARTLDYLAAALDDSPQELASLLFRERRAEAATQSQYFALASEHESGSFELQKHLRWMEGSEKRPLAYGLRNGHLVTTLANRVEEIGVPFDDSLAESFDDCRQRAPGNNPLVINASHTPLAGVPTPHRPDRFVVAAQVPLRRREDSMLPLQASFASMRRRRGGSDTGVFYPFFDPLTPNANYYGIFYRIVKKARFERKTEIEIMRRCVEGVGCALGLETVDHEETYGEAIVPCIPWKNVPTHRPDYLDMHRTYSACAPVITGDGMTRAALTGWLSAESILAGEDPVDTTNQALRLWRSSNRAFAWGMTTLSAPLFPVLRRRPQALLRLSAGFPDSWASVT
jgi:hypothetical protein